jgi:hypothetical protein
MSEYRFRDHSKADSPLSQMTLSTLEYPTETKARIALQSKLLELNRFIKSERLIEILAQPPGQITITDGVAYTVR